jgi:hypothetical protein
MTNLIKVGAIAALATVGVIFGNVTASALEVNPPAAPKITISAAQYKGEKNTIKFEGVANDHYRFVLTNGANKIQLKSPIRQELMQGSELSIEDLVKKYYPSSANSIPYDTPISIDTYWFDKEGNYDSPLRQTVALTVGGNLTKAVKLSQTSATLKNPESLPEAPANPDPATPANPVNPVNPEASTESENVNVAATPVLVESTSVPASPRKEAKPAETLAETGVSVYSVIAAAITAITAGGAAIIKRS